MSLGRRVRRRGRPRRRGGAWHGSAAEHFDLIVLDILLPSMNGYRVCESIRSDDDWTPILMLTAKSGEYDEAEGLETGADDFLTKPFSMVVLQARVRALLRRPRRRVDWPAVGDLRLDPLRRRCIRGNVGDRSDGARDGGARLPPRPRRPDRRQGRAARGGLGQAFDGDPNIVEVYVGHLRRKLDEPFGRAQHRDRAGSGLPVAHRPAGWMAGRHRRRRVAATADHRRRVGGRRGGAVAVPGCC